MERFELAASDPVELARLKTLVETGEGIKARYGSESSWPVPPMLFFGVEGLTTVGGAIGSLFLKTWLQRIT